MLAPGYLHRKRCVQPSRLVFATILYDISIEPNYGQVLSLKPKKGHDQSCPKYYKDAFVLFYSNFLYATIAILHDIQSLGWTYQSLTIYRIARYLLNISSGCSLVDACWIEFYYVLKVAKFREPIIIISSLRNIKDTFLGITTYKYIITHFWHTLSIYINRS